MANYQVHVKIENVVMEGESPNESEKSDLKILKVWSISQGISPGIEEPTENGDSSKQVGELWDTESQPEKVHRRCRWLKYFPLDLHQHMVEALGKCQQGATTTPVEEEEERIGKEDLKFKFWKCRRCEYWYPSERKRNIHMTAHPGKRASGRIAKLNKRKM